MTDSFHVYITGMQVFARRKTGFLWRPRIELLGEWNWNAATPSSLKFEQLNLPKKSRSNLHVYVGSALSKFMAIDLPTGLHDIHEQRAAAQAHMQHQLGLNVTDWSFTLDPVPSPAKSIVCAVRRSLMERIQELSNEHALRLVSLKPYVAGVWNAFQANRQNDTESQSALVAIENDAFTLFVSRSGALGSMSTLSHNCEDDLVDREIKRLGFSFGGGAQQNIRVALSEKLVGLGKANADKVLLKTDYLRKSLYPDFRDLLFASARDCDD